MKSFVSAMFAIILVIAFTHSAEGAMKKPPFNGSMFGKRGTSVDYEPTIKTLSAICDVCQAWYSGNQDNY
ncbi:unnamed protein product [Diamesa serratosioi]